MKGCYHGEVHDKVSFEIVKLGQLIEVIYQLLLAKLLDISPTVDDRKTRVENLTEKENLAQL